MFGAMHPDEIEDMLYRHHVGHLACIAEGRPYLVPVTFGYDGGSLYGRIAPGRLLTALRANGAVSFEIDEQAEPAFWRSVVVEAMFEEMTGPAAQIAEELLARTLPIARRGEEGIVVFRLRPGSRSGRRVRTERPVTSR